MMNPSLLATADYSLRLWDRWKKFMNRIKQSGEPGELQSWGRQAHVARQVRPRLKTVNDWLNGRDKMTGEQALRVQELLQKENRKRPSRTSLKPTG